MATPATTPEPADASAPVASYVGRRTPRVGLVAGVAVSLVVAAAVVMFALGTPSTPGAGAPPASVLGTPSAAAGATAPGSADAPLAIEIPGCVCHSDDPDLVAEHAQYRMNQCSECHADGAAGMGG